MSGTGERGFTLIETIVALTIVGLTAVALAESFAGGLRGQAAVAHNLEAVALAEAKLYELALLPTDSLARYDRSPGVPFPAPFGDYRWSARARPVADRPGLIGLAVLVVWPRGEYSLETVLYRAPRRFRSSDGGR